MQLQGTKQNPDFEVHLDKIKVSLYKLTKQIALEKILNKKKQLYACIL